MNDDRREFPQPAPGAQELRHQVQINDRNYVQVSGILHVDSFDDRQIVLDTELGALTIHGQDLQIKQLDLETGSFAVHGLFNGMTYSSASPRERRGQGLLERLFR